MKEVKLSPNISPHDMGYRVKQVNSWLEKGIQVKVTLNFKGRERMFIERGYNTLNLFISQTKGRPANNPKLIQGRRQMITVTLNPMK